MRARATRTRRAEAQDTGCPDPERTPSGGSCPPLSATGLRRPGGGGARRGGAGPAPPAARCVRRLVPGGRGAVRFGGGRVRDVSDTASPVVPRPPRRRSGPARRGPTRPHPRLGRRPIRRRRAPVAGLQTPGGCRTSGGLGGLDRGLAGTPRRRLGGGPPGASPGPLRGRTAGSAGRGPPARRVRGLRRLGLSAVRPAFAGFSACSGRSALASGRLGLALVRRRRARAGQLLLDGLLDLALALAAPAALLARRLVRLRLDRASAGRGCRGRCSTRTAPRTPPAAPGRPACGSSAPGPAR